MTIDSHDAATSRLTLWLSRTLLAAAAILFVLHFVHLGADFPNYAPWSDWAKYTDEGWYGDAAIRHYITGHWYWKGDFNPAVALPMWPAIEWLVFRFTGVSLIAARAATVCVFGVGIVAFYKLLVKFSRVERGDSGPSLAPALCVFFLCASPFFFAFERLAILEPLLITLTALALLAASYLHPASDDWKRWLPTVALGFLLPAMVLTKTTAVFLMPAIGYMVWARMGYRLRPALRVAVLPIAIATALWLAYFFGFVRPHYLEDYRYLFSANAYTGIELEPLDKVVVNTIADGMWMGKLLYPAFFAVLALVIFWRPKLLKNPLFPALLLWAGGYFAFLAYHNNLQPRYYMVAAAPITAMVAMGFDGFRQAASRRTEMAATIAVFLLAGAMTLPGLTYMLSVIANPTYTYAGAVNAIARIVREDKTHPQLILSISGSDITLMTGVPSIDDDFGTMELADRVKLYKPGWYVAWNALEDDKMDALTPTYHLERVAAFPAMDDQDRNLLILYRLDPTIETPVVRTHKPHTPKPLVTKVGQQPTTQQLEH